MLPTYIESDRERSTFNACLSLSGYLRRVLHRDQMDLPYTFAQMFYLCSAPGKVYQLASYRKKTKNQWSRDDPAFVVVLVYFLVVSASAYYLALRSAGVTFFQVLFLFVGIHFALLSLLFATVSWLIADKYMRITFSNSLDSSSNVYGRKAGIQGENGRSAQRNIDSERKIEWMYAFDIHCNSFLPVFFLLYILHYFMLPYLVFPSFYAILLGNMIYAGAACSYCYLTSLGYSVLPFLENTELFMYPCVPILVFTALFTAGRINLTLLAMSLWGLSE